ncbi:hypothetical protein NDU88_009789 [Pleurodeles waltl]|uniref:Uncharacterized protein n=1 Tax=Pleurodeles waltl TaxID=8319 RepID=A0AAV7QSK4_PLEWA|nr:hypothetical protein NDU88_009789 [Pleurodeles waltl]
MGERGSSLTNALIGTFFKQQIQTENCGRSGRTRETREELRRTALVPGGSRRGLLTASASVSARCAASGARHTVWGLPLLAAPRASRRTAAGSREAGKPSEHGPGAEAAGRGEQLPRAGGCDQACCLFSHQRLWGRRFAVTVRTTAWSGH